MTPGEYLLALRGAESAQPFAELAVQPSSRRFDLPSVQQQVSAVLGDVIRLHGLDQVRTGDMLTVTLVWQALTVLSSSEQVFVHLVAPDGAIVAQSDAVPAGGYDTARWVPGEVIVDPASADIARRICPRGNMPCGSGCTIPPRGSGWQRRAPTAAAIPTMLWRQA